MHSLTIESDPLAAYSVSRQLEPELGPHTRKAARSESRRYLRPLVEINLNSSVSVLARSQELMLMSNELRSIKTRCQVLSDGSRGVDLEQVHVSDHRLTVRKFLARWPRSSEDKQSVVRGGGPCGKKAIR